MINEHNLNLYKEFLDEQIEHCKKRIEDYKGIEGMQTWFEGRLNAYARSRRLIEDLSE